MIPIRRLPSVTALCFLLSIAAVASFAAETVSGHWEGTIEVPGSPLDFTVDLDAGDSGWAGAIDIPAQRLAEFPLAGIVVEGNSVTFALEGIPGEPVFKGTIDGDTLAGELHQGGAAMPFRLRRTGDVRLAAREKAPELAPEVVQKLTGRWAGTIEVPGRPVPVAFVLRAEEEGSLAATCDSPDEGRTGMPVTRLAVDGETFHAELSYAGVVYDGTLDDALTTATGTWKQSGNALPLTLRKEGAAPAAAFPPADPESVGIPPRALELLSAQVDEMVENEEIVGGELLVVRNRRTVFREAYGRKDRESGEPMETGALYCVRSMTKPLVGTAIQMLIDEGALSLETPVREILPSFEGPVTGKITVKQLLTHSAGFPFTTMGRPLKAYESLVDVAAEATEVALLFEPGEGFQYSDAGSDTLGAIVQVLTGAPVEEFVQERILDPLGMTDTYTLLGDDETLRARVPDAYSGGTGAWSRHWDSPSDEPIFPIFLTSQSLYSTTTDYARFLALWMDGGKVGDSRLLSAGAVSRALEPYRAMEGGTGLAGVEVYYGQQWMVYARAGEDGERYIVAFGHNGSDGTHAWAWPERDLMVLFFTQSRGTLAGTSLENAVQTLLIDGQLDSPSLAHRDAGADELREVAGLYWDETNATAYYVISPKGNGLTFERPGSASLTFKPDDRPLHYVHESNADLKLEFVRSEKGKVTQMRTIFGDRTETDPRHVPPTDLPSVEQVVAKVREAHGIDGLKRGAVRMSGTFEMAARNVSGSVTRLFDETGMRTEIDTGAGRQIMVTHESRAWSATPDAGVKELEGALREQTLAANPAIQLGDWKRHYETVEVLKRLKPGDRSILLVRVVGKEAPGATMFVDEKTGLLMATDMLVQIPGMGMVGLRTRFEDHRDVDHMQLPFREKAEYATPLIGEIVTTYEEVETEVDVPDDAFAPPVKTD